MRLTRGTLIFVGGLIGLFLELARHLISGLSADPTLVLVFAAMLGLPKLLSNGSTNGRAHPPNQ
jgi:hypothetical protein